MQQYSTLRLHEAVHPSSPLTSDTTSPSQLSLLRSSLLRQNKPYLAHADNNDFLEQLAPAQAMLAGGLAGTLEHCCVFPIDTIKTRMQTTSATMYTRIIQSFKKILQEEGFRGLYSGITATALSAAPSHAAYFASYEYTKNALGGSREQHTPFASICAGIVAVIMHDAIATPMDVVKQRMQLRNSPYRHLLQTIKRIAKDEGIKAFYNSYLTTLLLNIPYVSVQFVTYEGLHTMLHDTPIDDTPVADILCASIAAASGAIVSNPLDVMKTRIQTHNWDTQSNLDTPFRLVRNVIRTEGWSVLNKGLSARVALHAPSAAICWTVYEGLKRFMLRGSNEAQPRKHQHSQ